MSPAERPRPTGIRFRISVVLLLSTLNTVALAAGALLLFYDVAAGPPRALVAEVREIDHELTAVHDALLATDDRAAVPSTERVRLALDRLVRRARALGEKGDLAVSDLVLYRDVATKLATHRETYRLATPGDGPDPTDAAIAADLGTAYVRADGSLFYLVRFERPAWVERAAPFVPWALVWVVAFGLSTMVAAWRLQRVLTHPLERLAEAARGVGAGSLTTTIPVLEGAPEIVDLGVSLGRARDRLVATIVELDARGGERAALLEGMSDGALLVDGATRVLESNRPAERLLAALAGLAEAPAAVSLAKLLERRAFSLAEGETEVRSPDAARLVCVVRVRSVAKVGKGGGSAFAVFVRDVTRERELDQLKLDFLSVVTHELKTPLTAIEGYARLLELGKAGALNPKQAEFVATIRAQARVLEGMVQNLLDATRLEGGTLGIDRRPIDLGELVGRAARTFAGGAETRGIALSCHAEPAVGVVVRADAFRLDQVLGNLVGNAMKFTPPGGTIEISAGATGDEAWIVVADSGRGIPAAALGRIFEKFYQVEQGDTRIAGGAGLGLYISRMLVEAQGGRISVSSRPGAGSSFEIRLPREARPEPVQSVAS